MKVLCVGLNWRAPVGVRERVSFDASSLASGLARLHADCPSAEFAILSTCNRTEIYAATRPDAPPVDADDLIRFVSVVRDVSLDEFYPHLNVLDGASAVRHLFEVAAGLDSLVVGEAQILGQVKEAYQSAVQAGTAGPILHAICQKAFQVAKRIQSQTGLSRGRLSIASAAVDYIRGVFETFHDKTVLVIGAGKMAELTVKHLQSLHPGRLLMTNRNPDRAARLAEKFAGQPYPFDRLHQALVEADIVVSSTAAEAAIVDAREFRAIMKERRHRMIAIVDIALPRDFDVAIGEMDNVLLWNIDDLEKVRNQTLSSRRAEIDEARGILEEEYQRFEASIAELKSGPIITQLDREYQRIIDDELEWLWPQLNGISDADRERIQHFAHRIKNKLLHPPKLAIREHLREGGHGILETIQRVFGLTRDD